MNQEILMKTVAKLLNPPRGLLAIDESAKTCNARFEALGIQTTEENRRQYRALIITAPEIEKYISGYILYDETIRQKLGDGTNFTDVMKSKGLQIGIKVDEGLVDLPEHQGEQITQGLEGLDERLQEYKKMGATFAKWRAAYFITNETPSESAMKINAEIFAKYVLLCHGNDIVPIVEPEIMLTGNHSLEKCYEVTARNLEVIFKEFKKQNIFLPGVILKTSMVLPGKDSDIQVHDGVIAKMTIKCLKEKVPDTIGGIVFLSGGQNEEEATIRLSDMHHLGPLPWLLTFSYSRAIQNPVLKSWAANPEDIEGAQVLLLERAKAESLASVGEY